MKQVRSAIIGFGGIAKSHKTGYEILEREGAPVKLVALCDIDPTRFTAATVTNLGAEKAADLGDIRTYTNLDEMLGNEELDMVDICVPSYLHKEIAIKAMRAGKNVLSEKPMALCTADCEEMIRVSKECGVRFMVGQVLRFEPLYLFLKKCIEENTYGKLKNLFMERLSAHPTWGFEHWFEDTEKSGGCILDMHIHDIDMARFLLGEPKAVSSLSYDGKTRWQVTNTRLYYDDVLVVANGSWDEATSVPFTATYRARFEKASILMDAKGVTVYPDGGKPFPAEIPKANRMAEEIRAMAMMTADPTLVNTVNTPESACATVTLVEKLRESADNGGKIIEL